MVLYDKYKRGHQVLNGNHQRLTYKKKGLTLTLQHTQSN